MMGLKTSLLASNFTINFNEIEKIERIYQVGIRQICVTSIKKTQIKIVTVSSHVFHTFQNFKNIYKR